MKQKMVENNNGFTLIELMAAISIFSVVMLISMGSILSVFDANRKSQSLRSVMDNFNFTMESMTRTIRFGRNYHCGSSGDVTQPLDCPSPFWSDFLVVKDSNGSEVTYKLSNNRIIRSIDGGQDYFMTSPDITITNLAFRVFGSSPYPELLQPQVIVVVEGFAGTKPGTQSSFSLETTVSQRQFDFQ